MYHLSRIKLNAKRLLLAGNSFKRFNIEFFFENPLVFHFQEYHLNKVTLGFYFVLKAYSFNTVIKNIKTE